MKKLVYALVFALLVCAAAVYAQGSFTDVPTEHWAYDAINQLQQKQIVVGYPDGTFSGKKPITRYEFAVTVAKLLSQINVGGQEKVDLSNYATKDMIPDVSKFVTKADIPAGKVTPADLDNIKKLVNEFKDELAAMGTDVDAVKRNLAALDARVAAVEKEQERVKWSGTMNIIGLFDSNNYNYVAGGKPGVPENAFDADLRVITHAASIGNQLGNTQPIRDSQMYRDFDLNIVGKASANTTVHATFNYGNYVNSITGVDTIANRNPAAGDMFIPYYMYVDTVVGPAAVTAGRFPIQFTPYTLRKGIADSYVELAKIDDGNYPVDGVKAGLNIAGVDFVAFAAKHNLPQLVNGLLAGPTQMTFGPFAGGLPGVAASGNRAQSAGVRATMAIPFSGNLGLTYLQHYSPGNDTLEYDTARVYGADMSILLADKYNVAGSFNKCEVLPTEARVVTASKVDYQNDAWDVKVATGFGKLGVNVGYKSIGRNYAAAGCWDKIGNWINPKDVKGAYGEFSYPLRSNLKLDVNGEYLAVIDGNTLPVATWGQKDDKLVKAAAGVKWGVSKTNTLTADYEMVTYDRDAKGVDSAVESYMTLGLRHEISENAFAKIGYQVMRYDAGDQLTKGANDYAASRGVVQLGVSF